MAPTVEKDDLRQNPFWQFSIGFYRHPEVGAACLSLQDEAGVDVNVLLFLLWLASRKIALTRAEVAEVDALVKPWRSGTIVPLRTLRRALKTPSPAVSETGAERLRSRVKAAELAAENLQQDAMFRFADAWRGGTASPSAAEAARQSIVAYEETLKPFAPAAVEQILAAFDRLEL